VKRCVLEVNRNVGAKACAMDVRSVSHHDREFGSGGVWNSKVVGNSWL
jgi:hypothetical protein